MSMAAHQAAKFSNYPKDSHDVAVKRIGKCLLKTKDKGLICQLDVSNGLEVFVHADFPGDVVKDPCSV